MLKQTSPPTAAEAAAAAVKAYREAWNEAIAADPTAADANEKAARAAVPHYEAWHAARQRGDMSGASGYLTTAEAAAALGVSARRVRALVAVGRLAAVREETPRGPVIWVDAASLVAFRRQPQGWRKGRPRKLAAHQSSPPPSGKPAVSAHARKNRL